MIHYDELLRQWVKSNSTGPIPKGRHGHLMFCYYQYLIVYGGQGEGKQIYGDLWVYDTIKDDWHMIMDSGDVHTLQH